MSERKVVPMSETEESCGCIDGMCSVLPKSDCIELCETETEKNNFKSDFIPKKSVLKYMNWKNTTIKAAAKFDSGVSASVVFPDGKKIAAASGNKINILDAITLKEVGTLEGHTDDVRSVAVFPDGSKIVSGSDDKTIKIWDATTLQEVGTLEGHTSWIL